MLIQLGREMSNELSSKKRFELITGTLSWLNNTFTKFGMKPIEDLPEAYLCDSYQCVLARALTTSLEDMYDNISVGYGSITMSKVYHRDQDARLYDEIQKESFDVTLEVSDVIKAFDAGQFPEFVSEDSPQKPDESGAYVELGEDGYPLKDEE